jgi:peptide/nickel transport system substrate-binding protein
MAGQDGAGPQAQRPETAKLLGSRFSKFSYVRLSVMVVVVALLAAACGGTTTILKPTNGGTVTSAEAPGALPNYILPLASGSYFNIQNGVFNQLYVPLYSFQVNGKPIPNKTLSLAYPPVFSNHDSVVTITMKHWQWSNGTPITARDVIFWMNLLSAATDPSAPAVGSSSAPGPGWGASVPGGFPSNVVSYVQTGTYTVVLHLNASYDPTWFYYNELCQITPMPQASWDKLSLSGPVGNHDATAEARTAVSGTSPTQYQPTDPGTATSGALGVAQFLNEQSQDLTTYDTNPLWKVVNGPFKMTQYTTSGYIKMVPNESYSGSLKPKIGAFEEEPFTSDSAEFDALRSGSLTIGYVPPQDLAQKAQLKKQEGYSFSAWNVYGFIWFPVNFTNTKVGPIFKQLYFRQAFQSLINQKQYIKDFLDGIGSVDNGPVPTYPAKNLYESPLEATGQVFPYSPTKARNLLKDNGWTVNPGGTSVCARPGTAAGDCGVGIAQGVRASFSLLYPSGSISLTNEMEAMQSAMKKEAGIELVLSQQPASDMTSIVYDSCSLSKPCNNWDMATWGSAWTYSYGYLPTGEELFETGADSNPGDYSSPTANKLIKATNDDPESKEVAAIFNYENYIAKQLPQFFLPNGAFQLTMYKSKLKGLNPQNLYGEMVPQYYSLTG